MPDKEKPLPNNIETATTNDELIVPDQAAAKRTFFQRVRDSLTILFSSRVATVGLIIVLFWMLVAIFAPLVTQYTPLEQDWKNPNSGPSTEHILGTDELGRDLWSRLIYGARVVLVLPTSVEFVVTYLAVLRAGGVAVPLSTGYTAGELARLVGRTESRVVVVGVVGEVARQVLARAGEAAGHLETLMNISPSSPRILLAVALVPPVLARSGKSYGEPLTGSDTIKISELVADAEDYLGYIIDSAQYDNRVYAYEKMLCVSRDLGAAGCQLWRGGHHGAEQQPGSNLGLLRVRSDPRGGAGRDPRA